MTTANNLAVRRALEAARVEFIERTVTDPVCAFGSRQGRRSGENRRRGFFCETNPIFLARPKRSL